MIVAANPQYKKGQSQVWLCPFYFEIFHKFYCLPWSTKHHSKTLFFKNKTS